LFWGKDVLAAFKPEQLRGKPDRHYEAMKKYQEAPMWWYAALLVLSFVAGQLAARIAIYPTYS